VLRRVDRANGEKFAAQLGILCIAGQSAASPAHASGDDWGINGVFKALSNGLWAQTNDRYRDETVVLSTWTISATTCTNPTDCVGNMHSDQGWSAPICERSGLWYVKHTVPHWEPCPDGTAADGLQTFMFYPATPNDGTVDASQSDLFAGSDQTQGPSGAFGTNKPLVVSIPFRLTRIS
jgi:hypothetical protein